MEYYQLLEFECSHLFIYENGELYNSRTNNYFTPNYSSEVELNTDNGNVYRISVRKLYGYYFNSPWANNINYQWLGPFGYNNYYVTSEGKVWSFTQHKYMKPFVDKDGYHCSNLIDNNFNSHTNRFHRLVALAYISNPLNKPCVNHLDGNRQNNIPSNLEWCTDYENNRHARFNGDAILAITDDQVHQVCALLEKGCYSQGEIGRMVNVSPYVVKNVRQGSGHRRISQHYNIPNSWKDKDLYANRFKSKRVGYME